MQLLEKSPAKADLRKAAQVVADSSDPLQAISDAKEGDFRAKTLTMNLTSAHLGDTMFAPEIPDIEADLARVAAAFEPTAAIGKLKSAYFAKLMNDDQYEDVKYEMASTATFCDVLDGGKVALEECLPGSGKNPDTTGRLGGVQTRVEVTVVHDDWPPRFCEAAQEIAEAADVGEETGYTADLNIPFVRVADGALVKRLIEILAAARREHPGQPLAVDGFTYVPAGDEFRCQDVRAPLRVVEFNDMAMLRQVNGSAVTRDTMTHDESQAMGQLFPRPKGVVACTELPTNPQAHRSSTLGQKLHKMFEGKTLEQCEVGAINIIVLGQPMPMNDGGVYDALVGAGAALVPHGLRTEGHSAEFVRSAMGPFTSAEAVNASGLPDDQKQYITYEIEKFRRVSAVLLFRLKAGHGKAELILNPNAHMSIKPGDAERIRNTAVQRIERIGKGSS
jgi:hypothetical protein